MKTIINIILFGMLVILFAGCGGGGGEDSDSSPGLSSAKAITSFSLNGPDGQVEGTIDEKGKTIAVVMPEDSSLNSLIATFTTTGIAIDISGIPQTSGLSMNDFTAPVTYTVTAENNTQQDYIVTVTPAPSSAKSITSFSINGSNGSINEQAKTIAVTLPNGTDVANLVAIFTTTGTKVEVGTTVQFSGQTPNDFTNPAVYTVTAADASAQAYIVTVTIETERKPATAIRVSLRANNEGTILVPGDFCTRTPSISGLQTVTPDDDRTIIAWELLDNGVLQSSGKATLGELKKKPATIYGPFLTGHTIMYKATADSAVSHSASVRIA